MELVGEFLEEISKEEKDAYLARGIEKFGDKLKGITIQLDGDFVNITYELQDIPFQRIRRITGYLVGSLDRFNNAKRSEEHERVKHGVRAEENG